MSKIEMTRDEPIPETKWRKPCPRDRVLFATDGTGAVVIIDHVGPCAAYIMGDDLLTTCFKSDELVPCKKPGIWIWEGVLRTSRDYWGEYNEWFEGKVRPMDASEARAVREDDDIWDRSLWIQEVHE